MKIKPYYLVQAFSRRANKQQTEWLSTEVDIKKRLTNQKEARRRANAYAQSLNDSVSYGVTDWKPIVRLVTDKGNFIVEET